VLVWTLLGDAGMEIRRTEHPRVGGPGLIRAFFARRDFRVICGPTHMPGTPTVSSPEKPRSLAESLAGFSHAGWLNASIRGRFDSLLWSRSCLRATRAWAIGLGAKDMLHAPTIPRCGVEQSFATARPLSRTEPRRMSAYFPGRGHSRSGWCLTKALCDCGKPVRHGACDSPACPSRERRCTCARRRPSTVSWL